MQMTTKLVKRLLLWMMAGLLTLLLIVLYVNRKDQPPSQAAVQLQRSAQSVGTVADAANGYVYAMGFCAPDDADAATVGLARAEWTRKRLPAAGKDDNLAFPDTSRHLARERDPAIKGMHAACKESNGACAAAMHVVWMPQYAALLARYEALLNYRQWRELWPSDLRAPSARFSHVLEGQAFLFIRASNMAKEGDIAGLKRLLERDHQFWRMVLAESSSIIVKLIAAHALEQHYKLSNVLLRRLAPAAAIQSIPDSWHTPISARERSMLRVMANEWEYFGRNVDGAAAWLLQRQATSNLSAARMLAIAEVFALDFAAIPAASNQLLGRDQFARKHVFALGIYNFGGEYVANEIDMADFLSYGKRAADVEGKRRLTLLAAALRAQGVKPDDIAQHLQQTHIRNPYDGKPFSWDAAAGSLAFAGAHSTFRIVY